MLILFFLLLSYPPPLWRAHFYPLKCHEAISAPVWTSSALPAPFPRCSSPHHLAGSNELDPVCQSLSCTPKVDVDLSLTSAEQGVIGTSLASVHTSRMSLPSLFPGLIAGWHLLPSKTPRVSLKEPLFSNFAVSVPEKFFPRDRTLHMSLLNFISFQFILLVQVTQDGSPALEQIDN